MIIAADIHRRLTLVARIVRWLAVLAMIAIVALVATVFLPPSIERALLPDVADQDLQLATRLSLLPAAVLFYGLARLAQMMSAFEQAAFFSSQVPAHLQGFSASVLICELLQMTLPLQIAAIHLVRDRNFSGEVSMEFKAEQLLSVLLALLFLILSWVLREATRVAEDSASIV